jgi:DNA-binding PadR family transcriptional regulator
MIRELARHGYRLGPGTMYPLLRSMERRGWLESEFQVGEGQRRASYVATASGKVALREAKAYVYELYQEMKE